MTETQLVEEVRGVRLTRALEGARARARWVVQRYGDWVTARGLVVAAQGDLR